MTSMTMMAEKKSVLFLLRDFERGGIPRVMLNLVEHIDLSKYTIDIFCGNPVGIFRGCIPQNVRLLKTNLFLRAVMCNLAKESGIFLIFAMLIKTIRKMIQKIFHYDILNNINKNIICSLKNREYDVIWACAEGLPSIWSRAAGGGCKKIIWIHNDYSWECARGDKVENTDFSIFDSIVCVSEATRKNFNSIYPEYERKTEVLYNLLNETEIIRMSEENTPELEEYDGFKIFSIGRFSFQKNFEAIPKIAAEIILAGQSNFRWYIIGNGGASETAAIKNAISEYHVGNNCVLLGEQANPYKYLKKADLFVLPSRYESYPTVINEAKLLGIPVVSSVFNGADEILDDKNGVILPVEKFSDAIANLINKPEQLQAWKMNKFHVDTDAIISKFYEIIHGEK